MSVFLKYGLMYGLFGVVSKLILYFINPALMINSIPATIISWVAPLVFMILACLAYRKRNEGILDMGEGIRVAWTTLAIGLFISTLFSFILINKIDPGLKDILMQEMKNDPTGLTAFKMGYEMGGRESDAFDKSDIEVEMLREEFKDEEAELLKSLNPLGFSGLIAEWLFMIFTVGLIYSLVIALVIRTKKTRT